MGKSADKHASVFDAWVKSQQDYFDTWTDVSEKFQDALKGMDFNAGAVSDAADLFGVYRQWQETFGKYFDGVLKTTPLSATQDTMSKLFGSVDTYVWLYQFWAPMVKALQERGLSGDAYKDLLDPAKYMELLNKIFGFSSAETVNEFVSQASSLVETWGSKGERLMKPWSEAMAKNMDALTGMAGGDADASMKILHNIYAAFDSTFGKAFKIPAVGKDREQTELLLKTLDKYAVFLARNTEYQHTIVATGQKAMEKVVSASAEKLTGNGEVAGFDDFFELWTSVQEKEYLALFRTEAFARLQGAVLDAALDVRSHFYQLMELFLSDYPVALRSEMDDIYKTIYTMKKNLRELKKMGGGMLQMQKEMVALKRQVAMLEEKQPSRRAPAKAGRPAAKKKAVSSSKTKKKTVSSGKTAKRKQTRGKEGSK
jgi:hypothetical protein